MLECGELENSWISITTPDLDIELFNLWGKTAEYHFWEEDEELMFSSQAEIDLIISAIDKETYLPEKNGILLNTLLVILYDASVNNFTKLEIKLIHALKKRKKTLNKYKNYIAEYLQQKVFPMIEIE